MTEVGQQAPEASLGPAIAPSPLVLYISTVGEIAGAELCFLEDVQGHRRSGQRVALVCPPNSALNARAAVLGVPVSGIRFARPFASSGWGYRIATGLALVPAILRLRRVLRQYRPAVVIATNVKAGILTGIATRLPFSSSFVITMNCERLPTGLRRHAMAALNHYVIGHSRLRYRQLQAIVGPNRAVQGRTTQRLGTYVQARDKGLRKAWNLPGGAIVFGMAGQLVPWKGQRQFIRAAASVAQAHSKAYFIIVGDAAVSGGYAYRLELDGLCQGLGVTDRLRFLGWRDDMPEVMAALDVFVLPSHHEPFGRVVTEAMAAGKPVIATAAGGPLELIAHGRTGLLVPVGDVGALADAMSMLVTEPQRRREIGQQAKRWIVDDYGLETPWRLTAAGICARILAENQRRRRPEWWLLHRRQK